MHDPTDPNDPPPNIGTAVLLTAAILLVMLGSLVYGLTR